MAKTSEKEVLNFQAETKQLLDLMIHSLYSNKEIFLRELISNASDAIDKLRYEALTKPDLVQEGEEFHIRIDASKSPRQLVISDNGIGMNKSELMENLGTIAHSGTKELLEKMKSAKDEKTSADLIGQFGVGFYSAFMVADEVTVLTRRAGETEAWLWQSKGDGTYSIEPAQKNSHGTTITLKLKPVEPENGIEDYTDFYVISRIVKRYSDFIQYPIKMRHEVEEPVRDKDGKITDKTEKIVKDEVLNSMKPIWVRKPSEVSEEEYTEFYKHIAHDWHDPLLHFSIHAEGILEYHALLFIPSQRPYDLFFATYEPGLRLYAKRVLIMDRCKELLPNYLRFVQGVVDSADLSLNVSREMLQQDRQLSAIRKRIVKKILDELKKLKEKDFDKYLTFWNEFGVVLKEGYGEDYENKDKLAELFLFQTTADKEKLFSLPEIVSRMKTEEDSIYYILGNSRKTLESSPHIEHLVKEGKEVLLLTDPVDDFLMQHLHEYEGKKFVPADRIEAESKETDKDEGESSHKDFLAFLKENLKDFVDEVKISSRLVSSPARLVREGGGMSPQLEKLLKQHGQGIPSLKPSLEINPNHEVIQKAEALLEKDKNSDKVKKLPQLLLGYAYLAEGRELPDPIEFNKALIAIMQDAL
ncbi:MAG: molecular chaperone HtpG [Candidatus Hydrogenedentota bacterium]|nr:MAG: molecular chaperone HtpG [Candidatus Hydrogenedentota bacterium]